MRDMITINDVQSELYDVLGIVRFIGGMQPETKEPAEMLRELETTVWAARAAEKIIEGTIDGIDHLGE